MMDQVTSPVMDHTAQMIGLGLSTEEIRENLLSRGMSEYNAYLCFKAAQLLLNMGFYDKEAVPDPFKGGSFRRV